MTGRAALVLACAALALACDPREILPPDPATVARVADQATAARLRDHLRALPVVTGASVTIDRAAIDPLARAPRAAAAPKVAIALIANVDDVGRLDAVARQAAHLVLGDDARIAVAIMPALDRPALARLGPFTVAADARGPLLALIAGGLAVIAGLALALTVTLAGRAPR